MESVAHEKRFGKTVSGAPDRDRILVRKWIQEVLRGWRSHQQPLARVATNYVAPTQRQETRTGQFSQPDLDTHAPRRRQQWHAVVGKDFSQHVDG